VSPIDCSITKTLELMWRSDSLKFPAFIRESVSMSGRAACSTDRLHVTYIILGQRRQGANPEVIGKLNYFRQMNNARSALDCFSSQNPNYTYPKFVFVEPLSVLSTRSSFWSCPLMASRTTRSSITTTFGLMLVTPSQSSASSPRHYCHYL
jgi:hypothetical protein